MALPRDDSRIILHLDYDCFYAAVIELAQPSLKFRPLAVQQKQIVVTCNYEARRRGISKLQLISEARRVCPDVVVVLGEDLTRFRDASKELYCFLRERIWGERVEKLGFDEIFLDVTDMVGYNADLLNLPDLENSFFHLDRQDPTVGFAFDATDFYGPAWPDSDSPVSRLVPSSDLLRMRLLVASHLAGYLRHLLQSHKGYTATAGISTSKLLAKLAGKVHKPNSQTTLLPPYVAVDEPDVAEEYSNVIHFMDGHQFRGIPGIGSKIAHKLHAHLARTIDGPVTVRDVRLFPGMGPVLLNRILGGPGSSKGIGARIWGLVHGVDDSEVLEARDVPTQISIEDSYGRLDRLDVVKNELTKLTTSLLRRMRTDLTEGETENPGVFRWRAQPRTLRVSTRLHRPSNPDNPCYPRSSRSAPLPRYVFNMDERLDVLAQRLVHEHVLSLFRRLHPEKGGGWNLSMMNIAVTNMAESAGDNKHHSARDISTMFRSQESARLVLESRPVPEDHIHSVEEEDPGWEESENNGEEEGMPSEQCQTCGMLIPRFAQEVHEQYHQLLD